MTDAQDVKAKVQSLDMPGKLLLFGSLAGLVGTFLSWWSVSFEGDNNPLLKTINMNAKVQGIDTGSGKLAAIGLAVAIATLAHVLFGVVPDTQKALYKKIQLGGTGVAVVAALWFWLDTDGVSGEGVSSGTGLGFWISLLGGAAAAYGAFQRFKTA